MHKECEHTQRTLVHQRTVRHGGDVERHPSARDIGHALLDLLAREVEDALECVVCRGAGDIAKELRAVEHGLADVWETALPGLAERVLACRSHADRHRNDSA